MVKSFAGARIVTLSGSGHSMLAQRLNDVPEALIEIC